MLPIYLEDFVDDQDKYTAWLAELDLTVDPGRKPEAWDVRDRLEEIRPRTLVVVGAEDFICGTKWADVTAAGIPGAQLVVVPRIGHMPHLEAPENFAKTVTDFMVGTQDLDRPA